MTLVKGKQYVFQQCQHGFLLREHFRDGEYSNNVWAFSNIGEAAQFLLDAYQSEQAQ